MVRKAEEGDPVAALGRSIARARSEAGMTQDEVADALGIGNEAVSRMERGVSAPSVPRLFELADLFCCPVDRLLGSASGRVSDQALHIARALSKLSADEREIVMGVVDLLASGLAQRSGKRRG